MTYAPTGTPPANGTATVVTPIGLPETSRKRPRLLIAGILAVVVLAIAGFLIWRSRQAPAIVLSTGVVSSGALTRTITASGTVNPQDTILVGTQVSGTISAINVDYNSIVHTGQVLALIDPTGFQAAVDQSQAQLAQSVANARVAAATAVGAQAGIDVQRATADAAAKNIDVARANASAQTDAVAGAQSNVAKAQSALVLAQQTIARDTTLLAQGYVAQNAVDADRASLETNQSGLAGAQASLTQARSQALASAGQTNQAVSQSRAQSAQNIVSGAQAQASVGTAAAQTAAIGIQTAQVKTARYDLAHTTITSPVNGTVIARNVSLGQTVAASFSTPTLFTIARDLTKMEVDLAVGEPDIGSVNAGQPVTFTVLAFPSTTFAGTVSQVRQNPTVVGNVVTYDTVVIVDNKAGLLRPGMTANALVQTQVATDALIVPIGALTWHPSAAIAARYHLPAPTTKRAAPSNGVTVRAAGGSQFGATLGAGASAVPTGTSGQLFVERAGDVVRVPVRVTLTTGTQAAVVPLGATLGVNDVVVTGDNSTSAPHAAAAATSAFGQPAISGGAARGLR